MNNNLQDIQVWCDASIDVDYHISEKLQQLKAPFTYHRVDRFIRVDVDGDHYFGIQGFNRALMRLKTGVFV